MSSARGAAPPDRPGDSGAPGPDGHSEREGHRTLKVLRSVRRRLVGQALVHNIGLDLLVSLGFLVLLLLLDRLLLPGIVAPAFLGALLGVSLAVSLARTCLARTASVFDAAVAVDEKLQSKERVSTAVYLDGAQGAPAGGAHDEALRRLLGRDAARVLEGIRVSQHFPIRLSKSYRWVVVLLLVAGGIALFVPSMDLLGVAREAQASAALKDGIEKEKDELEKRLKELAKQADEAKSPEAKKLLEELRNDMAKANSERKESPPPKEGKPGGQRPANPTQQAMVQMSRREDTLRKGLNNQKFDKLKQARQALKTLGVKQSKMTRKLRQALRDGKFEQAKEELQKLQDKLSKLQKKKPSEMTKEDKEQARKLAEELASLSKDAAAMQSLSSQLGSAASGLQMGNLALSLEGLDLSMSELGQLAAAQNDADLLKQALEMVQVAKAGMSHLCPNCGKKSQQPGGT